MGKDDVPTKKRRKFTTSTPSDPPKQVPVDVYKVRSTMNYQNDIV